MSDYRGKFDGDEVDTLLTDVIDIKAAISIADTDEDVEEVWNQVINS